MSKGRLKDLDVLIDELSIFANINPDSLISCNRAAESLRLDSREEEDYVYFSLRSKSSDFNFENHLRHIRNTLINGD